MAKGYRLSKGAVQVFLNELKGLLNEKQVILNIIEREDKEEGYNLSDCRAELGIDNNDIKEYLKSLSIENYVETCDDERNKNSNSYYIFGKFVNEKEIYIKVKIQSYDKKIVVCMSFHFAEYKLNYPYK